MRNIWRIFCADWKRLTASVVAVVVMLGLCLVPCLYAWFNILSNWDPYGPASTGRIKVAVASEDDGYEVLGLHLNIGELVLQGLETNDQMGWVFVDDAQTALDGVNAGDYYAALILPPEFTGDFVSILEGDLRHPEIQYYENEKKNAIAPKITGKAKTAVQEEINTTILEKVADALTTAGSVFKAMGLDGQDVANDLLEKLSAAQQDMDQMAEVFRAWNQGPLDSYLIEITGHILAKKDEDGQPLVDKILDAAGQKGTGKWTSWSALDLGVPLTLITEAVYGRFLSADKEGRLKASELLKGPSSSPAQDLEKTLEALHVALYAAKLISYTQGFMLMRAAAASEGWELDYGSIAMLWRGGCIIRSAFLGKITQAFRENPALQNLLLAPYFTGEIARSLQGLRIVCAQAALAGIPAPALSSALAFFDGVRSPRLGANLLQAQRDYFGAHTYERVDAPRGQYFHTNWTGAGGDTASSAYDA